MGVYNEALRGRFFFFWNNAIKSFSDKTTESSGERLYRDNQVTLLSTHTCQRYKKTNPWREKQQEEKKKHLALKTKLCIFGRFCKSGSVTHLFHCETSYTSSQQQIYLLYLQAPPFDENRRHESKKRSQDHTA